MTETRIAILVLCAVLVGCSANPTNANEKADGTVPERTTVVISDLHLGLGQRPDKIWDPMEDFRWVGALRGFLSYLNTEIKEPVDLVIAGDFLELWQPPKSFKCKGNDADYGCTIAEMKKIVQYILAAHRHELMALADFTRGDSNTNRVYIIPGNHDSSLVIPEIWQLVADIIAEPVGRVSLVENGVWASVDGEVLVEHGHQIGSDVNGYKKWPRVTAQHNSEEYIIRPWGELFVQKLFNAEESSYPIIDNLTPETVGARYRMADRGLWGSAADIAKFIAFNIFETSAAQKAKALGRKPDEGKPCTRAEAEVLGHRLVLGTLRPEDPFRQQAESKTAEAQRLRSELDVLVKEMPDAEIQNLCAQQVDATTLGAIIESRFVPRKEILRTHLETRVAKNIKNAVFIYGHTHQYESAWELKLEGGQKVTILNSGAFQRLIDEAGYLERVKAMNLDDRKHEGLSHIDLDSLAPCYGTVLVRRYGGVRAPEMKMWHMAEGGTGKLVDPTSPSCR